MHMQSKILYESRFLVYMCTIYSLSAVYRAGFINNIFSRLPIISSEEYLTRSTSEYGN